MIVNVNWVGEVLVHQAGLEHDDYRCCWGCSMHFQIRLAVLKQDVQCIMPLLLAEKQCYRNNNRLQSLNHQWNVDRNNTLAAATMTALR